MKLCFREKHLSESVEEDGESAIEENLLGDIEESWLQWRKRRKRICGEKAS